MNSNLRTIDLNHLDSIAGGDESFKKELISIFLEQIPVFISNMKRYYAKNRMENLAREAHTAKSSALIFGKSNTGLLLKEIQHLAESNEPGEIQDKLFQVEKELNLAISELHEILK